jgi:predicted DNA-binding transcriptional regulator YafY
MDKVKRALTLMVQLQQRDMPVHVIAKELMVTERTAYRYLRLFKDIGIQVDQNIRCIHHPTNNNKKKKSQTK